MSKTATVKPTGYCMKQKSMQNIANATAFVMSNGRKAWKGTCESCGTAITAIAKVQ